MCTFTPIGCDAYHSFQGNFDGKNHTISGMVIERTNYNNGIFGHVEGKTTIKNLILKSNSIRAERYCGGIVGYADADNSNEKYVEITNCHVEDVTVSPINGFNLDFGGIVGYINNGVTVSGCTCAATIDDPEGRSVGGIVGECYFGGTIIDCLFTGIVRGSTEYGAIVGEHFTGNPILTNNYYTSLASMGVGIIGSSLGEDIEGARHAREYDYLDDVPNDIGEIVRFYGEGDYLLTAREKGLYYQGKFYYPAQETLVLYDNQDNSEQIGLYVGRTADVTLQGRTIYMDRSWNTLILPFSVDNTVEGSLLEGTEFMQLTTASFENGTLTLTFDEVESVQAGEPFLVRWAKNVNKADLVDPVFENVVIGGSITTESNTDNLIEFKGSYAPITLAKDDKTKLYLGTENTLYYPNANVTLGAFRCYFELLGGLTAGTPANGINNFVLDFGDDATSIVSIENGKLKTENGAGAWYSLDGRKLSNKPTAKGIYINNGKKVVIK